MYKVKFKKRYEYQFIYCVCASLEDIQEARQIAADLDYDLFSVYNPCGTQIF